MMALADGVCDVTVKREGDVVEGAIRTRALSHLIIGIDDTDSREGGATFALALALIQHLGALKGVIPIEHHVAMLYPSIPEKTAGNSCSYIELAIEPRSFEKVVERSRLFVEDEAFSPEWGIALRQGFRTAPGLRAYGRQVRSGRVEVETAQEIARMHDIELYGGRGVIGALGAIALSGLPNEILLDPERPVPF
jgi:tRNA(Ile2) C34 agmatinyltransferase TiaS